jgi:tetratricopeptide (TPR) repeat protein
MFLRKNLIRILELKSGIIASTVVLYCIMIFISTVYFLNWRSLNAGFRKSDLLCDVSQAGRIDKLISIIGEIKLTFHMKIMIPVCMLLLISCKDPNTLSNTATGDVTIDKISSEIINNPEKADLYFQRAKLYYDQSVYDHAIYDIQKALTLDSLNPEYYHLLSDAYLDYYNSRGAVNTMNKVLSIYPERIASLLKMAELKHILKDYDGSVLTINEVIRIDPQNGEAYFMLGMNFRALGDNERAINAYQTAVEMDSGITDAWIILGEMHEEKKNPKALQYYESAILSNPESMQALHAKAYYLQNHGKIPQAQDLYKQIILKDNTYSDAYLNSGLLYMESDSVDKAFEQFDILTGIEPSNYMGFYMRGIVHEKKGRLKEALRDYESAHKLNIEDKQVRKALETLKNHL